MSILARFGRKSYTPVDTRLESRTVVYTSMTAEDWIDLQFLARRPLVLDRPVEMLLQGWWMWRIMPQDERERTAVTRLAARGLMELTSNDCWKLTLHGVRWIYQVLRHVHDWQGQSVGRTNRF